MQSRGASAFVLDLRENFGGLLKAGVDTARLFLHDGVIIQQQYRGKGMETFRVEKPGPLAGIPMVIFVNGHTASAAEIIAGSLKAQGRAKVIGSPTFGKDTVQLIFDLEDGSSLHVTAAHWWVPGLEPPLAGHGLQPDILVEEEPASQETAEKAAVRSLFGTK
jgi:carboxyl-terminal processing protease